MNFVTLFDSRYLDKGLVMYESLINVSDDFRLYIVAFDDKCYEVLKDLNENKLVPISMRDFECDELIRVKSQRTHAEYCWTCSSFAIAYVLDNFENECTYVDADLFFYEDPESILQEMRREGCNVQIIEQRFDNRVLSRQMMRRSGKYCVEFNTFNNEQNSRMVLRWWQDRVIECCTVSADGKIFGDQKYLDDWLEMFDNVHVVENVGAGVAPWNITNYELVSKNGGKINLRYKLTNQCTPIVFYHFHNMSYVGHNKVNIEVFNRAFSTSKELVNILYYPYINKIEEKRRFLREHYAIDYTIRESHPTSIGSIFRNLTIREVLKKIKGYSIIGLSQFMLYQKNHIYDFIDTTKINTGGKM